MITVNGEARNDLSGLTISELIAKDGFKPELVAVEYNETIIDKADYGTTCLKDGDIVEIVMFMGGGAY